MKEARAHPPRSPQNDYKIIREILFERIRRMILDGHYDSGTKLLEEDLAQRFGVSRTPVREALRKLESEGLVEYLPRRGVLVKQLSPQDTEEIYLIRAVLEGLAARLAATQITPRELESLRALQVQMERASAAADYRRAARIHTRFNMALYGASRNKRLTEILTQFNDYIEHAKYVSLSRPRRAGEIRREHQAMVDAIAAGDGDAAEAAARHHVENARRAFSGEVRVDAPPQGVRR